MLGDDVEFAGDTFARDRVVDDGRQAFPAEVVDDAQDPEAAAVGQRVGDEVEAPALIGILRDRHRCSRAERTLAATALAHRQALLAIESVELLPAHRQTFTLQQKMQPAIAEAPAFGRQFPRLLSQVSVVRSARTIAVNPRLHADEAASTTLRIALVLYRPGHGSPPRPRR